MFPMAFKPSHLRDINDFGSCKYIEKRSGERFSLCLTPILQGYKSDSVSAVNDTIDFAFIYMFFITLSIFPEIPEDNILDHRVVLLIVSNAVL